MLGDTPKWRDQIILLVCFLAFFHKVDILEFFADNKNRGLVCENVVLVGGGKFHRDTISKDYLEI